jgi:hypothetical protein
MLEKSKPFIFNITRKESVPVRSLKDSKEIRILQADKGNCTIVLNECTCTEKMSSLLESGAHKILLKDTTSQIQRKMRKLLTKHKTVLPSALNNN